MTIDAAVAALLAGEPVIMPTDTVYGVGTVPAASGRLFEVKERPVDVAVPVLAADAEQAWALADAPDVALVLAELFWPGGLTIVVPRRAGLDWDLGGADATTIGLRVPDHDTPRALARAAGPLAVTSANRHGRPTPETADAAARELPVVHTVIDGGPCAGAPSTVVWCAGGDPRVLREGRITIHQLEERSSYRFVR